MKTAAPQRSRATDAVIGAVAGIASTAVMAVAAERLYDRLRLPDRYPLPPRELTERSAEALGRVRLSRESGLTATLIAHFGFGAGVGALYPLLFRPESGSAAPTGIGYGVAVWTASYLGWIPILGLLRPATRHPPARNLLMIVLHVIWGATLGLVFDRLVRSLRPFGDGPNRDI